MIFTENIIIEFDLNREFLQNTTDFKFDKRGLHLEGIVKDYKKWIQRFLDNSDKLIIINCNTEFGNRWFLEEISNSCIVLLLITENNGEE